MVISRKKRTLIIFLSIVVVLMLFSIWYQYTYSMDRAVSFEVNSPANPKKLLIATQGSEFKNKVTNAVVNNYKKDSVYIRIIDISDLIEIQTQDYDAVLLIHTWEYWKPPQEIELFVENAKPLKDRIVVLTTSGEGSYKMDDIDAITGESKLENVAPFTNQIIEKIDLLLKINSTKNLLL